MVGDDATVGVVVGVAVTVGDGATVGGVVGVAVGVGLAVGVVRGAVGDGAAAGGVVEDGLTRGCGAPE